MTGQGVFRADITPEPDHAASRMTGQGAFRADVRTRTRSPLGEHGVDGESGVHGDQAHQIPGQAEVAPVDMDLGVKTDLAAARNGRRGVEGQRPGTVAHGQRAGNGDTRTRRPDTVRGKGDVRVVGAVASGVVRQPPIQLRAALV